MRRPIGLPLSRPVPLQALAPEGNGFLSACKSRDSWPFESQHLQPGVASPPSPLRCSRCLLRLLASSSFHLRRFLSLILTLSSSSFSSPLTSSNLASFYKDFSPPSLQICSSSSCPFLVYFLNFFRSFLLSSLSFRSALNLPSSCLQFHLLNIPPPSLISLFSFIFCIL